MTDGFKATIGVLLVTFILVLAGGCCGGGPGRTDDVAAHMPLSHQREMAAWDDVQHQRYELAVQTYEELWAQAAAPVRGPGAVGLYSLTMQMAELCGRWQPAYVRFDQLREPLQIKILARANTPNEFDAWYLLVRSMHNDAALLGTLNALRGDHRAVVQFGKPAWRGNQIVEVAKARGRDDLASLVGPSMAEKTVEGLVRGVTGVVVAPIVYPLGKAIAPK